MSEINNFFEYLQVIKKHSENTISSYQKDLLEFLEFNKNNLKITKDTVTNYLNWLYERNQSKNTIARKLTALRVFYNYLVKKNVCDVNYFTNIKNPRKKQNLPKFVKEIEIDKMFQVPDIGNPLGQRNALILRMLYATGLRISELINIKCHDINYSERTIRILGKGSKERVVVYGINTKECLDLYLSDGYQKLNSKHNEYLFVNKNGGRLSDRYIRKMLDEIILKASVSMHVSPHMLRHTFATSMLNNGADLVSVKDLLGHASLNTTSIYTHVTNEMIMKVYNNAHPRAK